jgi:hypothetical protein
MDCKEIVFHYCVLSRFQKKKKRTRKAVLFATAVVLSPVHTAVAWKWVFHVTLLSR